MWQSVSGIFGYDDVERLVAAGVAKAAYVNYTALIGAGILHTKFMIADNRSTWLPSPSPAGCNGEALWVGTHSLRRRLCEHGLAVADADQGAGHLL